MLPKILKESQIRASLLKMFEKSKRPRCCAVIAAAGSSDRFGGEDKLFFKINDAPVLAHTLSVFQKSVYIDEIILVTHENTLSRTKELCKRYGIKKAKRIISGGPTRVESVSKGVSAVSKNYSLIAIHDGARPCVDEQVIKSVMEQAAVHHAAAPGVRISSTIKRIKNGVIVETIDRNDLVEIQTPQVFAVKIIKAALANAMKHKIDITDDCMAAELIGTDIRVVEGSRNNIKITTREDVIIAEKVLENLRCRVPKPVVTGELCE